jgi:hypothetical protein
MVKAPASLAHKGWNSVKHAGSEQRTSPGPSHQRPQKEHFAFLGY